MSNRLPPNSIEAEEAFLGAALISPRQVMPNSVGTLDPSDFYQPVHQHLWSAMLAMHDTGQVIDCLTVAEATKVHGVTMEMLLSLQNATPAISSAPRYMGIIVETSRSRRLAMHYANMVDLCYDRTADDVLAADDPEADRLIASRTVDGVPGLSELSEFLTATRKAKDVGEWLIPHIMRPRWRVIIVAGEGVGKATAMRFFGLHVAAGRDPWCPSTFITPRRVLYVDAENSDTTIAHQTKLANTAVDLEAESEGRYHIWHREAGVNLRDRRTRGEFERVLEQTRPEIVFAGPLYKMFRRKSSEDMEQATTEFVEILDDFRVRYNFGLMLEAHAPKGVNGGYRDLNPRGSAVLLGWPEFGITLEPVGNPLPDELYMNVDIGRFRRDREPADWPVSMERGKMGQRSAWSGRWPNGRNRGGL